MRRLPPLLLGLGLTLTACGGSAGDAPASPGGSSSEVTTAAPQTLNPDRPPKVVDEVATGLEVPWGLDFLPDGTAVVTERDSGRVLTIRDGSVTEVGRIDEAVPEGEAGLLGVAVSPDFADDSRLFLYVTTGEDNRIVRTTLDDGVLGAVEPILTGIPNGFIHDGGRLAFGPDDLLYASTGEIGEVQLAQDRRSLGGKILRITPDGDPAPDNPDPESPIFTLGHRNVQGLAFDGGGQLWASEFGSQEFDELNRIDAGNNYGWPQFEGSGGSGQFTDPQVVWRTSEASPSGLAFLDGELWMASLRGQRLWRVSVKGDRAVRPRDFFVGEYGRLRTVAVAPDGNLWVTTSNRDGRGDPADADDRILVIRP
ncbi:PQQ-dependent sugar dehydrogenase [Nocardioides donggukensis]|uniref:PQQ-dependent sugar dehydrogenase n=1 Tax=Nocardioides donggukensis TaxID=2774019 RepID=A0A927K3H2_9ACTN|nr:PQQ-dependent sugar dehydrogenase [Nocardioides donggukensis]MBD8868953.1 PQQ-dependent sugar dehydrogenase [Nocardioides donggukensis]